MASLKEKPSRVAAGQSGLDFDPPAGNGVRLASLQIVEIEFDSRQPRKDIGDLKELVESIREHGVIQPVVVEAVDQRTYRLIAGERRLRAAREAGLATVPAVVRSVEEHQRLAIQLTENLARKGLDAFEEADGYHRLMKEFTLTHEQIARKVGKSRTTITETVALAKIPSGLREKCRRADIPVSRETLYLMARQGGAERMEEVFADSQNGLPREDRRDRARTGEAREAVKPKAKRGEPVDTHIFDTAEAHVFIQSKASDVTLTNNQIIDALVEVLEQMK